MESLPNQIIEEILRNPSVSIRTTLNFGETCSRFRELVHSSNYVWKRKYQKKWPQFMKFFGDDFIDWFAEVRLVYEVRHHTHAMLSKMPSKFYKRRVLSDAHLHKWATLIEESPRAYEYVVFNLMAIIKNKVPIETMEVVSVDTHGNLTLQYYAAKVLRFISQLHVAKEWNHFITLPESKQTLERGATFVAQWFQPNLQIKLKNIVDDLDNLAAEVKKHLKIMYPKHPVHEVPLEILEKWKKQNLETNQWSVLESQQIIESLSVVFYEKRQFKGDSNLCLLPTNSSIYEVLKRRCGRAITLCIIYESIARRLGLKYEPIRFPDYFLLKFTGSNSVGAQHYHYIDVFMNGKVISKGSCPYRHGDDIPEGHLVPVSARKVVECFALDLKTYYQQHTHTEESTHLRASLEFLLLITPLDVSAIINLARLYMMQNVNTGPLIKHLTKRISEFTGMLPICHTIIKKLQEYRKLQKDRFRESVTHIIPKKRPSNMKYAVGMIMKHSTMNYTCIIYDWDPICIATFEWQMEAGVHKLRYKDKQPFYRVLAAGNLDRYVAQENLTPTTTEQNLLDLNRDLGRHFSHFFETHYVPNAEKQAEFPEDACVRKKIHIYQKFGMNL